MEKEGRDNYQAAPWFSQAEDEIDLDMKRLELEAKTLELETKKRRIESQERILKSLTLAFIGALIYTSVTFLFQGFHIAGFNLDISVLIRLGDATIGAIVGLLGITIRAVFGLGQEKPQAT